MNVEKDRMEVQATAEDFNRLMEINPMAKLQVESIAFQRTIEEQAMEIAGLRAEIAKLQDNNGAFEVKEVVGAESTNHS